MHGVKEMKLKNVLLVVNDIEKSVQFYKDIFGLIVMRDFETNVILSEGLVLQERKSWEDAISQEISYGRNNALLYFEERNLDAFIDKLNKSSFDIKYWGNKITDITGRSIIRLYDPDGHLIEVGEPFN